VRAGERLAFGIELPAAGVQLRLPLREGGLGLGQLLLSLRQRRLGLLELQLSREQRRLPLG